jgi:hypothetical protein
MRSFVFPAKWSSQTSGGMLYLIHQKRKEVEELQL